jgi:hypothetical protein
MTSSMCGVRPGSVSVIVTLKGAQVWRKQVMKAAHSSADGFHGDTVCGAPGPMALDRLWLESSRPAS